MSAARKATLSLCILGSLVVLGTMVYAGRGWQQGVGWGMQFVGFGFWNLAPYAGLAACGLLAYRTQRQAMTAFIGSLLVVCFGILLLVEGFFVHPDAQNALIFIVLPFYQWIGVMVLLLLIWRL